MRKLRIGDVSPSDNVHVIDEDRLCYLVKNINKGAQGIRTKSKELLNDTTMYVAVAFDASQELDSSNLHPGRKQCTSATRYDAQYATGSEIKQA